LIGGPNLASQALDAGLIDEVVLVVWPIVLGGRNAALRTSTRADLDLVAEHRFDNGAIALRYAVP
jgi:riboflavin biosynthesis pyrimidine reductase